MKAIFKKIVAKSDARKELNQVYMTDKKLVATNAYVLLEVDQACFEKAEAGRLDIIRGRMEVGQPITLKPEELDLEEKILETMPIEASTEFPKYQSLIPSMGTLANEYVSMKVNPALLANMAEAIAKTFKNKNFREVEVYIPKAEGKPMVIRRQDGSAEGVIMPLK